MIDHGLPTSSAETLVDLVRLNARAYPDEPALTATGAEGIETLTYRELDERTTTLACGLIAAGVGKGDRVAFLMNNDLGLEATLIYSAVHKAGAVAVPINGRLVPAEVDSAIRHAEVGTLIFGPDFTDHAALLRDAGDIEIRLFEVGPGGNGFSSFADLLASPGDDSALPAISPDDHCDWLYTSGTTGTPKCVMLSHANCLAGGMIIAETLSMRVDDLYLTPFPFFTSSGTHTTYLTALSASAHAYISNNTRAEALLGELESVRATAFGAVPAIYSYMLDCPTRGEFDLSLVRSCWFGGAAINAELVRKIKGLFPRAEVLNIFGQTESGNPGTYLPGKYAEEKAGSIGRTGMPGVEIRVVAEDGTVVERSGTGELHMRSPAVMQGYYANPEATATTIEDGWLRTGDLVMVDEDGFLFVHDRLKDMIIRGGHNVASIEVESAINDHPEVIESAVVAKPHESLGEDVMAFVVLTEGGTATGEELSEFLRDRLADYKIPREWAFIEALPRNPTGKILKRELRERAREMTAAGDATS